MPHTKAHSPHPQTIEGTERRYPVYCLGNYPLPRYTVFLLLFSLYLPTFSYHTYSLLNSSQLISLFLKKGVWSLRRRWEWKYKVRLCIAEDQSMGIIDVHYHDRKDNDLIAK